MCIRDRVSAAKQVKTNMPKGARLIEAQSTRYAWLTINMNSCLLYTSDAADERSSVDLGGRRIIKKKSRTVEGG